MADASSIEVSRFRSRFMTRDASACYEGTVSPIFLFQRRCWQLISVPDDHEEVDGQVYPEGHVDDPDPLTWEDLADMTAGEFDVPCAVCSWHTELVFLTREEGHRHGEAKFYNYRDGWRVYAVPAHGELIEALRDGSEHGSRKVSHG